ncbi:hypothetical protein J3F83DRAFT_475899 [Trichoderma novae-zelandiae]
MAHDARGRRERPRRSTGGSEAYLPPQRRRAAAAETPRHRGDVLNLESSWGREPYTEGGYLSRRDYDEEVETVTRPTVTRRQADARPFPAAQYRRQRSLGRETSGVELNRERVERVVITESPTDVRYTSASDSEDDARFERRRAYGDRFPGEPDEQATGAANDGKMFERIYVQGDDYIRRRPVSPVIEDIDNFDDFHFTLPVEEPSQDADSDLETPTTESESTQKVEGPLSSLFTAPGIFSSSYSGTAELGAQHDVNLTVVPDLRGQTRPLFRWLHIRQEIMNFDAFWVQVSRSIQFRDAERSAVAKLQAEVKRQCVKTRYSPQGAKVGYMEPRCMQTPIQWSDKDPSDDFHVANWICIPYFRLQQYSESPSASNTALFPAQTLLQSQYSRSSQQRDMDQAVCQLGHVPRGQCFHISQMWCLIVGNSVLVTCGTMSQLDLQGTTVKMNPVPGQTSGVNRILVSHGGALVWSLATKDCQTWFAFVAHFRAFWPRKIEFWRKDRPITAQNWDKVLKMAEGLKGDVKLEMKLADTPDMLRALLKPDFVGYKASEKRPERSATPSEYLHVFTLLSKRVASSGDAILQDLHEQLSAAERFLTEKTSYSAQIGYKQCELMTRDGLHEYLEQLAARVDERESDTARRSYDDRLAVFHMSDMLFQTFFPLTLHNLPTTSKFWGALSKLMKLDDGNGVHASPSSILDIKSALWQLTQDIPSFQDIMSFAGQEDRAAMTLPHELVTAWLHIVFGLIYSTYAPDWYNHIMKARQLMRDGMQKMVQSISDQDLLDKAVMLPTEVMSLITLNLLHDDVGKYDDICDTYSLYLNLLDTDITTKPSNRTYQHRIDLVKQEMTAVRRILAKQRSIIARLRNKTDGNFVVRYGEEIPPRMRRDYDDDVGRTVPGYRSRAVDDRTRGLGEHDRRVVGVQFLNDLEAASKLSPTDAGGFRSLFLAECAGLIEQREYEFRRDTEYAEDLEREISYKMEWTKDKQENAIYAFTLVTIIFLPLSAISSIFGMNTNDIRNMDFDQWLYWAVALPVTIIIIIAGLWWMDELGNATDWLLGGRGRSPEYAVSLPSGPGMARQSVPTTDYDSTDRPSEEMPGGYRRARYLRPTTRSYSGDDEVHLPVEPRPRRRRSSYYKF